MICLRKASRFSRIAAVSSGRNPRAVLPLRSVAELGFVMWAAVALVTWMPGSLWAVTVADLSFGSLHGAAADLALTADGGQRAAALAHYCVALQLEDAGKSREALAHYREVIKADPSNAPLVAHTAEVAMNFGSRDEAVSILRNSIKTNPASAQHYLNLVRFLATYAPDDPFEKDNAANAIAEALRRFPQDAAVYRSAVALFLLDAATRDQAAKVLGDGLKQPCTDPAFWLALGRVAQEVWPPGHQELRQQNRDRVNPFFEKALSHAGSGPAAAQVKLEVAQYYLLTNQLPLALALCEKLVPDDQSGQSRKLLYRLYEADGRRDQAYATLQAIVKENPGDVEQRKLLAGVCQQREDYAQAVTHLEAAIQGGGGDVQDYDQLSQLMIQAQAFERVIALSRRTTALYPDHLEFRVYAGIACRVLKRWDEAVSHFDQAQKAAAEMAGEPLNFRFYYHYGITLERAGRFDEGARQLEKSIELTPKESSDFAANTMNYLGYMWIEQGRNLDKAEPLIRRAIEIEPNNAAFIDSLGWLHFKKGDYTAALRELLHAKDMIKELRADDAEIIDHIGQTYQKLGERDKALESLKKARELDPSNQKIKERLDELLGRPKPQPPQPPAAQEEVPPPPGPKGAPAAAPKKA